MKPFQDVVQRSWGGLNEDENPSSLEEDELSSCHNAAPWGSGLGTRMGVNREPTGGDYVDKIVTGDANSIVKGLYHFTKRTDFQRDVLMAVAGKKVYSDDTTAITPVAAADIPVTGDNVQTFAQYRGDVFFAGYTQNITAATIHFWDGAAATFSSLPIQNLSAANVPNAKYILAKWGYLFVAGLQQAIPDNASNSMVVRFNNLGGDAKLTAQWPTANTIGTGALVGSVGGLREYGGEFITGLAEFQDNEGDWLLILTSHRLIAVLRDRYQVTASGDPFVVHSSIANGCVHQNAYVNMGVDFGDAIYMSRRGIHSVKQSQEFGGRTDTFLSWKIRRTFDTINQARFPFVCGGYDQTEGYVLFAVPTGVSSENDTILCLDVRNDKDLTSNNAKWYIWKLSGTERIASMAPCIDTNGRPRLYIGGTEGSVGYFSRSSYTDFGDRFSVSWTGKHDDFGAPGYEKTAGDMTVDIQPGGDYVPKATTIFDFGGYQGPFHDLPMKTAGALWEAQTGASPTLWDEFDWTSGEIVTTRHKIYDSGRGNTIATSFSHGGNNEPFFISGMSRQIAGAVETVGAGEGAS